MDNYERKMPLRGVKSEVMVKEDKIWHDLLIWYEYKHLLFVKLSYV